MSYHADMLAGGCQVAADEIERLRNALREIRDSKMGPVGQRVRNLANEALRHD